VNLTRAIGPRPSAAEQFQSEIALFSKETLIYLGLPPKTPFGTIKYMEYKMNSDFGKFIGLDDEIDCFISNQRFPNRQV
jgi:hypothetical protein